MWRPSHTCFTKWSNPYHLDCHTRAGHTEECVAFEAGADAMLKALKETGSHYDSILEVDRLTRQDLPDVEGGFILTIIPDEESK